MISKEGRQPHYEQVSALSPPAIAQATTTITRAFSDDPLTAWLFPDRARREASLRALNEAPLAQSLRDGHATQIEDGGGIAVWLPPGRKMSIWGMVTSGLFRLPFRIGLRSFRKFMGIVGTGERIHKKHAPEPHWYLLILAVDPALQGAGRGTALLKEGLERADAEGSACYLETGNERNLTLYERYGFIVVEKSDLGGGAPCVWAMRREPVS